MDDLMPIIEAKFPQLYEPKLRQQIAEKGAYMEAKAGTMLVKAGDFIRTVPLLITGFIKVVRENEDGKELLLYYLYPGETCAMSLTCCMNNEPSEITAVIEDDSEYIAIPTELADSWINEYHSWKAYVFNIYRKRFYELLHTIDSLAFRRLDERLMNFLKERSHALQMKNFPITHKEIANELNTSREVVSRLLKQLERKGEIKIKRNQIEFLN